MHLFFIIKTSPETRPLTDNNSFLLVGNNNNNDIIIQYYNDCSSGFVYMHDAPFVLRHNIILCCCRFYETFISTVEILKLRVLNVRHAAME